MFGSTRPFPWILVLCVLSVPAVNSLAFDVATVGTHDDCLTGIGLLRETEWLADPPEANRTGPALEAMGLAPGRLVHGPIGPGGLWDYNRLSSFPTHVPTG
jgi:hypothetical protein